MRVPMLCISLLTCSAATAQAIPSPCQVPHSSSPRLLVSLEAGGSARLRGGIGSRVSIERLHVLWHPGERGAGQPVGIGLGHQYSIYSLDDLPASDAAGALSRTPAATNGHLHMTYLPLELTPALGELAQQGWQLRLQPAVAVSSNLLSRPDLIDSSGLRMAGALSRRLGRRIDATSGAHSHWTVGLCLDQRFGRDRLYPTVTYERQQGSWSMRLGFPDSSVQMRLLPGVHTGLRIGPRGNHWYVSGGDSRESRFRHRSWQADWHLTWTPGNWQVEAALGRVLSSRYDFRLEDSRHFQGRYGSHLQFGVRLARDFPGFGARD